MQAFCRRIAAVVSVALGVASPGLVTAQGVEGFYIEGSVGAMFPSNVETTPFNGTVSGVTFANVAASIDYDTSAYYGGEIGITAFDRFRVGAGVLGFTTNWSQVSGSGTLTRGATTVNLANASVSRGQVSAIGLDPTQFDNDVYLYTLNGYYDFSAGGPFTPFAGLGLGVASIENATGDEFAASLYGGARYNVSENLYAGLKLGFHRISGPTDQLGIQYEPITAFTAAATIGVEF